MDKMTYFTWLRFDGQLLHVSPRNKGLTDSAHQAGTRLRRQLGIFKRLKQLALVDVPRWRAKGHGFELC